MDKKQVTMSEKDLLRIAIIGRILAGETSAQEAANAQGVSLRQIRRQIRAFREKGAEGLIHGNRGRPSPRRIPEAVRSQVHALMRETYADYNTSHLRDELASEHQIPLSYATVARLRAELEQASPRKHRVRPHRQRRQRAERAGQLVQVDGSDHNWLEGRGPRLTLIAFVDDATGQLLGALFREEEDAMGYMQVLDAVCRTHGVPQALYTDRHTIFQSPKKATLEQKLAGEQPLSHFGRTLHQLGIARIAALSPQAKGRVERVFGTLQDRLVKVLRRAGACHLEDANRVLEEYIPRYNQRFGRVPAQAEAAFSPWPTGLLGEHVFACHEQRTVANDNTISYGHVKLPIAPNSQRHHYVRARVDVYLHYSGRLSVEYEGIQIACFDHDPSQPIRLRHFVPAEPIVYAPTLTPEREPAPEPMPKPRQGVRPAADHPWRRSPISARHPR